MRPVCMSVQSHYSSIARRCVHALVLEMQSVIYQ